MNAAASHFVMGCTGTPVKVCRAMGLVVGITNVPVGDGCMVKEIAPWVDIAFNVSTADVYSELSVAAGWGVAPVKKLHAQITTKTNARKIGLLKFEILIRTSINYTAL